MGEPVPVSLKAIDDALQIVWSDGAVHHLTWRTLRDACPCASCRDERAQRESARASSAGPGGAERPDSPLLPVLTLAEARPLRVRSMKPVGNYAYGIDFTDGHSTGIYTLDQLRELGESAGG